MIVDQTEDGATAEPPKPPTPLEQLNTEIAALGGTIIAFVQKDPTIAHQVNLFYAKTVHEAKIEALCGLLVSKGLLTPEEIQLSMAAKISSSRELIEGLTKQSILKVVGGGAGLGGHRNQGRLKR